MINFKENAPLIPEKWHSEFIHFVDTGDASDEFLDFLERSPEVQKAADMVFEGQAEALSKVCKDIKDGV